MELNQIATENGISSYQDLAKLTTPKLIALFNSIPGVTAVKKFTTREIGMRRIAKLVGLELPVESITVGGNLAVAKEGAAPKKAKKVAKAKKAKKVAKAKKTGPRAKAKGTIDSGKKAEVVRLLERANGASLAHIMEVTGWQAHTVRGFISILGSKEGKKVESFKTEKGERTYRIK